MPVICKRGHERLKHGYCKLCEHITHQQYRNRLSLTRRQEISIKSKLKAYGMTPAQYDAQLIRQNGRCAICNRHQSEFTRQLAVDHNHLTQMIRGLLCVHCNTNSAVSEDKEFCMKASLYLHREIL